MAEYDEAMVAKVAEVIASDRGRRPESSPPMLARAVLDPVAGDIAARGGERALREAADEAARDAEGCPQGCNTARCSDANRVTATWLRERADRLAGGAS